ncbi:MAG: hypothetical protein IPG68_06750 [Micrococcales bacterium]|nr:hypothetical protein [Micrococcales bacterium]
MPSLTSRTSPVMKAMIASGPHRTPEMRESRVPPWRSSYTVHGMPHTHVSSARLTASGFTNLPEEWWHYTLDGQPYPDTYFDTVIG